MGPPNDNGDDPKPIQDTNPRNGPKSYADYQKLRRENPSAYYSTKVQQKMVEDAQKLGKSKFMIGRDADLPWWNR
ncbi:MAG: hypothetical protein P8H92_09760 [Paracoccaceae bacterium]|nr:hypothetical protein [Paracoccaceae bacterium]